MPVTMSDVLAEIDKDEPEYPEAAKKLGGEALPLLEQILEAQDPMRASKAAYLAALIGGTDAAPVLEKAASHGDARVRVAAAHALGAATGPPPALLERLLDDADPGVRKVALRSAVDSKASHLKTKITAMGKSDPEAFVRTLAKDTARKV
jgi:HEAT repeat protein